jgi:hypothetical protein
LVESTAREETTMGAIADMDELLDLTISLKERDSTQIIYEVNHGWTQIDADWNEET